MITTIKLNQETKNQLNTFKEYKNESYDEVLQKLVFIAKKALTQPEISQQTAKDIQNARARLQKGMYITEEDAKKRLGL